MCREDTRAQQRYVEAKWCCARSNKQTKRKKTDDQSSGVVGQSYCGEGKAWVELDKEMIKEWEEVTKDTMKL